jgi:small-conductance mechanosensitive channel
MSPALASVLSRAADAVGAFLPRLGGALALLVIGLLLARLLARLLTKALRAAGLDRMADRWGVHDVLSRAGLGRSLAQVIGIAARIVVSIVVVFAALSLLGLQFLSQSLNQGVLALPRLLIAAALVLAGVVLAGFARERVDRLTYQLDLPIPLGALAHAAVLAVFFIAAAAQLAISALALLILLAILLAGAAATIALAFGHGGVDAARALSAARYVRSDYTIGQEIAIGEVRGRITAIDATSTVLDTGHGRRVRIPNHMLLETIVTVYQDLPDGPQDE